jgi:hypothetical protein
LKQFSSSKRGVLHLGQQKWRLDVNLTYQTIFNLFTAAPHQPRVALFQLLKELGQN